MARNPWLDIPASDYEGHMGPEHADQLAPLRAIFGEVYRSVRPRRLALLGCATGNGLEQVDLAVTRAVVAVDINLEYAARARARYRALGPALEVRCADVTTCALPAGGFDLVHAALLFEHVEPEPLAARMVEWMAPGGDLRRGPAARGRLRAGHAVAVRQRGGPGGHHAPRLAG